MATQCVTPLGINFGSFPTPAKDIKHRGREVAVPGRRQQVTFRPTRVGACGVAPSVLHEQQVVDLVPLVRRVALKVKRNLPAHIEVDDLVGEGILGLLDAARKFDAKKSVKIESYAQHRIRGAILDGLRSLDTASRDLRKKHKRMEKALRQVEAKFGRTAEDDEAADVLGISLDQWHRDLGEIQAAGVEVTRPTQWAKSGPAAEENLVAQNQSNQFDICYLRERQDIARRALACLSPREREIVTLYHKRELTMKQIGARLRIDESRVSQLHSAAVERLRLTVQAILSRPKADSLPPQGNFNTHVLQ